MGSGGSGGSGTGGVIGSGGDGGASVDTGVVPGDGSRESGGDVGAGGVTLSLYNVVVGGTVKGFDPITADMNRVEMPPRFTLQANVPPGTVSVEFQLGGQRVRVDDAAPFLFSELANAAAPWAVGAGSYDVTVTAYTVAGAQGNPTGRLQQTVKILSTGMDPNFVKQSDAENMAWINQNVETALAPKMFTSSTGHVLPYRVYTPKFVSTAVKYPFFIFLIGRAERGSNNATYRNLGMSGTNQLFVGPRSIVAPNMQQEFPSVVLIPQCSTVPDESWRGSESEKATFELMDMMLKDKALPLDSDRVYLTGLSMGGEGTWDFVVRRPTTFACAVPLSGLYSDTTKAASIKNVPFWVFHSLADEQNGVGNSQRMVAAMKAAGAPVIKYTEYVTERHVASFMRVWTQELDLLPWMFSWWKK
jgi:poly(3-hydroxybutyrate) depolymerase